MGKKIECGNCGEGSYPHKLQVERVGYEAWAQVNQSGFVRVAVGEVSEVETHYCPMCGALVDEVFFTK